MMSEEARRKRRNPGSCDQCRLKKIKCDSATRVGSVCSSCLASETECTHISASAKKKRGPPKGTPRGQRTVPSIVNSILSTSKPYEPPSDSFLVKKLLIDLAEHIKSLDEEISDLRHQLQQQQQQLLVMTSNQENSSNCSASETPEMASLNFSSSSPSEASGIVNTSSYFDDIYNIEGLSEDLRALSVEHPKDRHFGGLSSNMLLKMAIDIKGEYTGEGSHDASKVSPTETEYAVKFNYKRMDFWTIHPWQVLPADECPPFVFPDPDLMDSLVSLYFTHINAYFPILHKPSFLRSIAQNLHHEDRHFGAVILAVCALGARISDDPRVFEDDFVLRKNSNGAMEHSAGWKWIRQIQPVKRTFTTPPCLYEIQLCGIYLLFMQATSTPESVWMLVSIGVRLAQDVGAHRKKNALKPTLETELWKRAFWMLYIMDIYVSAFIGRPRSVNTEEFDVDLPCMCDDEYWENADHPESAFQQPPGKPSSMLYYICFIKLVDVLGLVMRTIYAIRPTDVWTSVGMTRLQWNERIVAEVDSSLNKWLDEIPEHLRWDPNKENVENFNQSVMLYTAYYWVQIQVHRPFIPRPGQASVLSFPSLAICANAARSVVSVMEAHRRRDIGLLVLPTVIKALYTASIVLSVNVWQGRRLKASTSATAPKKELVDVYQCINLLSLYEKRWQQAGRFCDILREIISVNQRLTLRSKKRSRGSSLDNDSDPVDTSGIEHRGRQTVGSHRVSAAVTSRGTSTQGIQLPSQVQYAEPIGSTENYNNLFTLPTHTCELGSLPIYEDWPMDEQGFTSLSTFVSQAQQIWNLPNPNPDLHGMSMGAIPNQSDLGSNSNVDLPILSENQILNYSCSDRLMFDSVGVAPGDSSLPSSASTTGSSVNVMEPEGMPGDPTLIFHSSTSGIPNTAINESEWDDSDWGSYMLSVDEILQNINASV